MSRLKIASLALTLAAVLSLPALADDPGTHPPAPSPDNDAPSTQAFKAADTKMQKNMAMPYTGDADRDFARGMSAHHQGAVDMAGVELKYGKDPEMRALARSIVKSQQTEINAMQTWLAKHDQ